MHIIETTFKKNGELSLNNKPSKIVLHHAATSHCTIEDINRWHLNNGWSMVGYHYMVRKDGSIFRGRPENAVGAHCPNANSNSIGICAEGDFTKEIMSEIQKQAIIELCKDICKRYGFKEIKGHKELFATECPGTNYPLQEIKNSQTIKLNPYKDTVLKKGSKGEAVKYLQNALNKKGFKLVVDGDFGNNTLAAVRCLQSQCKLDVDGIVGNKTWGALS